MMKKIVKQVFIIFLLLLSINIEAYALPVVEQSEIKVTQIEVIANVPEQFTKEITVNFTLDNGTNALYTLNKANRYKVEGTIPVGNHTLNFININGNTGEYKISSQGALAAYEGQKIKFKIDVTINPDMVQDKSSSNNSSRNIGGNKTQEYLESTLIKDDNKSNDQVENNTEDKDKEEQQEAAEERDDEEKEDGDKKSIVKVFLKKWFSAVLLLVALLIFGVIFIIRKRVL